MQQDEQTTMSRQTEFMPISVKKSPPYNVPHFFLKSHSLIKLYPSSQYIALKECAFF